MLCGKQKLCSPRSPRETSANGGLCRCLLCTDVQLFVTHLNCAGIVYAYMFLCVFTCYCVCVCVCTCVSVKQGCQASSISLPLVFETGSLIEAGVCQFSYLPDSKPQGSFCLPFAELLIHHQTQLIILLNYLFVRWVASCTCKKSSIF